MPQYTLSPEEQSAIRPFDDAIDQLIGKRDAMLSMIAAQKKFPPTIGYDGKTKTITIPEADTK